MNTTGSDYFESDSGEDSGSSPDNQEKDNSGQTFLLNKEVCPGMEVGDTGSFKVTKVLESEYECVYDDEKSEESSEEPEMANSEDGMFE